MSDDRLERIEGKVDILVSRQIDLGLRVGKVEERVGNIEDRVNNVAERLNNVEERLNDIEEGQGDLRAAVMQIAEGHAAHTRQIERGFQQLHTVLDQRLQPLEDTVRDHTAVLKRNRIS